MKFLVNHAALVLFIGGMVLAPAAIMLIIVVEDRIERIIARRS